MIPHPIADLEAKPVQNGRPLKLRWRRQGAALALAGGLQLMQLHRAHGVTVLPVDSCGCPEQA